MVRVLATFPELVQASARADAIGTGSALTAGPVPPAVEPGRSARTIRVAPRPRLPVTSILALGLIAAAIWTLVAARERSWPDRPASGQRLAAEPDAAGPAEARR